MARKKQKDFHAVWFSDIQKELFHKLRLSCKFSEFVKQAFYEKIDIIKNKGA